MSTLQIEKLPNGLTLIVEHIGHVASVAYELLVPGGMLTDAEGHEGTCLLMAEMCSRGAGPYDARQLSDAFDLLGVSHGEGAGHDCFSFRGNLLAEHLPETLRLLSLMVLEPKLPDEELESVRSLFLQDLGALVDHPSRRVMIELSQRYFPAPWSRSSMGTEQGLKAATAQYIRSEFTRRIRPEGAVLSIAGNVQISDVKELVQRLFGKWTGKGDVIPALGALPKHRQDHIAFDSAQIQIAFGYPSAAVGHPRYYTAKVATGVLSGGMFGRLFMEVREKRGLCYSVRARHSATKYCGATWVYAGTTTERAHETFKVTVDVLRSVRGTVTAEELHRAKIDLKTGRIIGEESPGARASGNSSDWWQLGRVRSNREIIEGLESVSVKDIDAYLEEFPANSFMALTLGAKPVEL